MFFHSVNSLCREINSTNRNERSYDLSLPLHLYLKKNYQKKKIM